METERVRYTIVPSPIGDLLLTGGAAGLTSLFLECPGPDASWERDDAGWREVGGQLADYFAGRRRRFELQVPLAPRGTEFQRRVWDALAEVPFGATVSYAALAARIGAPRAVRAVAQALGRNPIAIIVPCHRVIGADGSLTGFAGGLARKRWLLEHEQGSP